MKICINGGHCPTRDSGAIGSRITEAEYTARMMASVADYLTKAGCTVLTVQEKDLSAICRAANEWGSDLFVSIHCNAANKRARGTETFSHYGSAKGKHLAACIQKQLIGAIDTIDRGTKEAGFYVLKHTNAPAALVEIAFIDNRDDETLLLEHQDDIARAIARGVTDYSTKKKPIAE